MPIQRWALKAVLGVGHVQGPLALAGEVVDKTRSLPHTMGQQLKL